MGASKSKAIFLSQYPAGMPQEADFVAKDTDVPAPGADEMLCRTVWMSVDPYMRGRMRPDVKSYIPPYSLDRPLEGGAVSEVIESNVAGFEPGDYIVDFLGGWKEFYISKGERSQKVDPNIAPLSAYLGVLGMPGMTAWAGVTQILEPKEGETIFVSGAAGAVGSLVCQLGKVKGCRVIGSAGSKEKCDWLIKEAGIDVALNYKDYKNAGELTKALAEAAPKGINCYFENVGGMHLEAALNCIALGGRMAWCGMIASYNNKTPEPGPSNLINVVGRGVMIRGFIVSEYMDKAMQFAMEVAPLLAQGKVKFQESVYDGLGKAPDAFIGLFKGDNTGKAVIRVGPDRA
ncbi:NADP-dependent oxidoreductase [Hyphococcus sp.]|uniref:NADP-dependent oxidoreductase n=1 Tax=Hyphococcus sp. TaxID=2038636 RepID=UPI00207DA20A|nr:MAG: NADP-dependent oxidoreductase [Marinicaulis sp.]